MAGSPAPSAAPPPRASYPLGPPAPQLALQSPFPSPTEDALVPTEARLPNTGPRALNPETHLLPAEPPAGWLPAPSRAGQQPERGAREGRCARAPHSWASGTAGSRDAPEPAGGPGEPEDLRARSLGTRPTPAPLFARLPPGPHPGRAPAGPRRRPVHPLCPAGRPFREDRNLDSRLVYVPAFGIWASPSLTTGRGPGLLSSSDVRDPSFPGRLCRRHPHLGHPDAARGGPRGAPLDRVNQRSVR